MSGVESFSGFEGLNQSFSAEQYAEFKARMAASAAQLKAMQAGEQKQKKKEEELAKILVAFIQSGHKTSVIGLVAQLLALNLPAGFIIALILINHPEIQEQTNIRLLKLPEISQPLNNSALNSSNDPHFSPDQLTSNLSTGTQTLPDLYFKNYTLPLEIKITIDAWIQEIAKAAEEHRTKLLNLACDSFGKVNPLIIKLAALCLGEFLMDKKIDHDLNQVYRFTEIFIQGIFKEISEMEPLKLS